MAKLIVAKRRRFNLWILLTRLVTSRLEKVIPERIYLIVHLSEAVLQVVFVPVEIRVERTVPWPAEVLNVLVISEKVILLLHKHWLVIVNRNSRRGTLRALKIFSLLICPN